MNENPSPYFLIEGKELKDLEKSELINIINERDLESYKNQDSINQKNQIIESTFQEIKKICDQNLKPDAKAELTKDEKKEYFVKSSK
jgi:hypothetical protein